MPPSICREKPEVDDLVMLLGTSQVIGKGPGPFTPLLATDCATVKLIRRGKGLVVEAFGIDNTNSLAYSVRENRLDLAMVTGLRARRPDPSTFILAGSLQSGGHLCALPQSGRGAHTGPLSLRRESASGDATRALGWAAFVSVGTDRASGPPRAHLHHNGAGQALRDLHVRD